MRLGAQRTAILTVKGLDLTRPRDVVYNPADPSSLTLTVIDPGGATFATALYPGTIQRSGVGEYYLQYTPTSAGRWTERWVGTSPAGTVEVSFHVDA
jgi:hypothetical protein